MEGEPSKNKSKEKSSSYWILLVIVLLVVVALIFSSQKEGKKKKKKFYNRNQQEIYDNSKGKKDSNKRYENSDNEEGQNQTDPNQDFIEKGYSKNDIQELTFWELEASEVPDLKAKKREGVVNTLAVSDGTGEGSCSELVIILKKSPHVKADTLDRSSLKSMKINQSHAFADTRRINEDIIRFAINKIIDKGHTWKWDVYVLKANNNAGTVSGPSAGSGVYLALLSASYSDYTIPKKLAITGEFKVKGEEIPSKIEPSPKKYQWTSDHCAQCGKYSWTYHFIYDKITDKLKKESNKNATNSDSQWAFCTKNCFKEWWNENVYNCSECGRQRFGSCSCCGNYHCWIWENKENEKFCSEKCIIKRYPKKREEGKIVGIGGVGEKIIAAVEKGCDIIIISKENSSDYHSEVPLSVQAKVKRLIEVESYQDLCNLFPF